MTNAPGQIWRIASPDSTRGRAEWDESMHYIPILKPCPLKPKQHPGGISRRSDPLTVLLTEHPVQELTWTWYGELLVRDDVKQAIERQGFTGIEFHSVRTRMKLRSDDDKGTGNRGFEPSESAQMPIPRLWELKVTGWGGMAPPEFGARLEEYCPACGYRRYRGPFDPSKLFDLGQWDRSDFFMIWPLPMYKFITNRVVELIDDHAWVRKSLIPIDRLEFTGDGLTPGGLRNYFSNDRARQIGEPLGIY